tara:strand:- start:22 stop:144 length:123 start_codon:yes stop_codon:yes gene_type:complete
MKYFKTYILIPFRTFFYRVFIKKENKRPEKPKTDDIYPLW